MAKVASKGKKRPGPPAPMHPDRKVFLVWMTTLVLAVAFVTAALRLRGRDEGAADTLIAYLGAVTLSFFPAGLAAFRIHRLSGLVRARRVLRWLAVLSLTLDLVLMIFVFLIYEMGWFGGSPDPRAVSPYSDPVAVAVATVALFVVLFLMSLGYLVVGVGVIWLMAAVERRLVPEALVRIRRLDRGTSRRTRKKDPVRFLKYSALRWMFNIPEVLDSEKLQVGVPAPSRSYPWKAFYSAMGWSVLFGTVIAISVSLDPFLRERVPLEQLLSLVSVASIFIPWLVLPWSIFHRLEAGIHGQHRTFQLYDGLRSRVFGALVAVGTLVLMIRLALREVPLSTILSAFLSFYLIFLLLAWLFTFAYFNYFEDVLAPDVAGAYARLLEKEKAEKADEEE